MILEMDGYVVDAAENGHDGLRHLHAARPALILLDLAMPVMDGADFRREQLADPTIATIPVVVCSATIPDDAEAGGLKAAAYLKKPIAGPLLLETIRYALSDSAQLSRSPH